MTCSCGSKLKALEARIRRLDKGARELNEPEVRAYPYWVKAVSASQHDDVIVMASCRDDALVAAEDLLSSFYDDMFAEPLNLEDDEPSPARIGVILDDEESMRLSKWWLKRHPEERL